MSNFSIEDYLEKIENHLLAVQKSLKIVRETKPWEQVWEEVEEIRERKARRKNLFHQDVFDIRKKFQSGAYSRQKLAEEYNLSSQGLYKVLYLYTRKDPFLIPEGYEKWLRNVIKDRKGVKD